MITAPECVVPLAVHAKFAVVAAVGALFPAGSCAAGACTAPDMPALDGALGARSVGSVPEPETSRTSTSTVVVQGREGS